MIPGTASVKSRQAVALSGGGADGAYGVGVLKALANGLSPATGHRHLEPEIFTGTSIGSYNAAFLVSLWDRYGTRSAAELEKVWLEKLAEQPGSCGNGAYRVRADPFEVLNPRCYFPNPANPLVRLAGDGASLGWEALQRMVHFVTGERDLLQRLIEVVNFSSFISREPWERTICDTIDFASVRNSSCALRIAATNWATGALKIFDNSDMSSTLGPRAIEASSALPGFFPPAIVGSQPFVDGGVLLNTPLSPAIRAGGKEIFIIYLDPRTQSIPLSDQENTLETLYRMQQIAWASQIESDIAAARRINDLVHLVREAEKRGDTQTPLFQHLENRYAGFRRLTIHRFSPGEDLGGALGLLNLDQKRIKRLIELGFQDAVHHNCREQGCVIADRPSRAHRRTRPNLAERNGARA